MLRETPVFALISLSLVYCLWSLCENMERKVFWLHNLDYYSDFYSESHFLHNFWKKYMYI